MLLLALKNIDFAGVQKILYHHSNHSGITPVTLNEAKSLFRILCKDTSAGYASGRRNGVGSE